MVNLTGNSTRAPVRVGGTNDAGVLKLTGRHRFFDRDGIDAMQRDSYLSGTKKSLEALTPAERRVLSAVVRSMLISEPHEGSSGYLFKPFANRAAIARKLGRDGSLVPYDVRMLRRLVALRLMSEQRRPLPAKTVRGVSGDLLRLGAGFEYVYSIDLDRLFCLLWLDPKHTARLKALAASKVSKALPIKEPKKSLWQRLVDRVMELPTD